jgi:hypothetical protein
MFVEIRFRYEFCGRLRHGGVSRVTRFGDQGGSPRGRGVGRRSKLELFTPRIEQWLRENPALSGAEILRRAQVAGYRGGKSALYELVRRLKVLASG